MLTRRRFVGYSALSSAMLACPSWLRSAFGQTPSGTAQRPLRLAILGSVYQLGSNLQTIGDRFLVGYPYEGDWHMPNVKVVSVYVDQRVRKANARPTEFERVMSGTDRRSQRQHATEHAPIAQSAQRSQQAAAGAGLGRPWSDERFERTRARRSSAFDCAATFQRRCAVAVAESPLTPCWPLPNKAAMIRTPAMTWAKSCCQPTIGFSSALHVFEEENHAVPYFNHKQLSFSFPEAQNMVKLQSG